ncbi:MAG: phosphate ABC transporter substrate-binding/OmpA family protein, partial [Planctomycetota bacterium]
LVADSSKFRGYIVDVIVVNRDYLLKNQDVVKDILGSYFRSAYHYRDSMVDLVLDDAKLTGTALNRKQAENLVKGIWWKNTQENFAHFGLQQGKSTQLLEDMIGNITNVLQSTGGMASDPTNGQPTALYYDKLLTTLQTNNFHPGLASETVRDDRIALPKLTEEQWKSLSPVGTLSVPKLEFGRGNDSLIPSSEVTLDDLVKTLNSFPQAYVIVEGNASTKGNAEANQRLAQNRAAAAERYLVGAGVDANRIHAVAGKPSGSTTVSFVLGQPPY